MGYDNISSASSQEDDTASKPEPKMEKVQKHAIERSFKANEGFLTTFESFQNNDIPKGVKESKSPKDKDERREEKTYTLIASTLHPKKIQKEELKKEKRKEEDRRGRNENGRRKNRRKEMRFSEKKDLRGKRRK